MVLSAARRFDPFTGEILNFDRRRYRPTKAQREPDGTVTATTPTGYVGRNTPAPPLPKDPPF